MSGMKVLRIWPYGYRTALRQIYRERPDLIDAPYAEHAAYFFNNHHGYGAGFSRAMRRLGYDAGELISNGLRLQTAWARENGLDCADAFTDPAAFIERAVAAQLAAARPDVVYVQGVSAYRPGYWREIREKCPSIRLVLGHLGFTLDPAQLAGVDFLFLNMAGIDGVDESLGVPTEVLYHAFDPAAGAAAAGAARRRAFVFTGGTGHYDAEYAQRHQALVELTARTDLRLWVHEEGGEPFPADTLAAATETAQNLRNAFPPDEAAARLAQWLETQERRPPLGALFPERCADPVFGSAMHRLLAESKIVFNMHVQLARGLAGNMRMFEAVGAGACLVTEHAANMDDLFVPDEEVVTYRSIEECVEKVRRLEAHDDERRRIAEAGRRRLLACHTWDDRAARVDRVIRRLSQRFRSA
jgi:spore maturation protein CgeB